LAICRFTNKIQLPSSLSSPGQDRGTAHRILAAGLCTSVVRVCTCVHVCVCG